MADSAIPRPILRLLPATPLGPIRPDRKNNSAFCTRRIFISCRFVPSTLLRLLNNSPNDPERWSDNFDEAKNRFALAKPGQHLLSVPHV